jgi:hypothetical protein
VSSKQPITLETNKKTSLSHTFKMMGYKLTTFFPSKTGIVKDRCHKVSLVADYQSMAYNVYRKEDVDCHFCQMKA